MSDILTEMAEIVGNDRLLSGGAVAERVTSFWNNAPMQAKAMVLPGNTEEVSAILRRCHALDQSVITQGGRSPIELKPTTGRDPVWSKFLWLRGNRESTKRRQTRNYGFRWRSAEWYEVSSQSSRLRE